MSGEEKNRMAEGEKYPATYNEAYMDKEDFLRRLEEERRELEIAWLNSATGMREFTAMRRELRKYPTRSDLPRDQMTAADYCRLRKADRDVLGRRIK